MRSCIDGLRSRRIIDFDSVDDRLDVALPGVGVCGLELFIHQPREGVDLPSIDSGCSSALGMSMIQRRLGAFPLRFKGGGTFSQDIVKFDDAVFDRAVRTLEAVFGVSVCE